MGRTWKNSSQHFWLLFAVWNGWVVTGSSLPCQSPGSAPMPQSDMFKRLKRLKKCALILLIPRLEILWILGSNARSQSCSAARGLFKRIKSSARLACPHGTPMQFRRNEWKKSIETLTMFIGKKKVKPCRTDQKHEEYWRSVNVTLRFDLHAKLVLNKGNACSERKIDCQMFKLFSPIYPVLLLPNLFDSISSVFKTRTTGLRTCHTSALLRIRSRWPSDPSW